MNTQTKTQEDKTFTPQQMPSAGRYRSSSVKSARPVKSMVRIKSAKPKRIVLCKTK